VRLHLRGVRRDGQQIGKGIDPVEPAGIDQAHEQVADPGTFDGFVAEAVFAMQDGHFQGSLAGIVVQGRAGLAQEQRQRLPVFEHVADGLAQAGVGLDVLVADFYLQPLLELRQHRLAVGLVSCLASASNR